MGIIDNRKLGSTVAKYRREGRGYGAIRDLLEQLHGLSISKTTVKNWLDNNDWEDYDPPDDSIESLQNDLYVWVDMLKSIDCCDEDQYMLDAITDLMNESITEVYTQAQCQQALERMIRDVS